MTAKTDDRQKRIREQEDIIRRALTNDKITYAEERAIIEPAHQILDELEGEPELEELNLTKPKGFTPLQRATAAIRNASNNKFDAALRAYLREITADAIEAGIPLDPDVRSALLAFQASQHREPLKQKRLLDRSNRLYYEVFCDENCEEKHKHKFYSDVLRARPDAKRKRRRLPPIQAQGASATLRVAGALPCAHRRSESHIQGSPCTDTSAIQGKRKDTLRRKRTEILLEK